MATRCLLYYHFSFVDVIGGQGVIDVSFIMNMSFWNISLVSKCALQVNTVFNIPWAIKSNSVSEKIVYF